MSTFTAVGVDGCPAGWFFVALKPNGSPCWGVVRTIEELVRCAGESDRIFVDIPIGLPTGAERRECDRVARQKLGRPRAFSVFPAPVRTVLLARNYEDANRRSREATGGVGVSKQTFAIVPKIREVDELLRRCEKAQRLVREIHPEICFWALNGRKPMQYAKKKRQGFCERRKVLKQVRPSADQEIERMLACFKRKDVARDDIADAMVAAVTALADDAALKTLPSCPTRDCEGLPMEMVFSSALALSEKHSKLA